MPPRHAYWTIILDNKPTAFRAHTQEELLPTLKQLQSRHPDAVMMWFARGRLWKSEEESRESLGKRRAPTDRRGPAWRPGGSHEDPRARFKIPRDEKRRRFREKLFGKDSPEDQTVPVDEERADAPPPAPDAPSQKSGEGPASTDPRPPKTDRPPIPTGPAQGARRSGPSDRKPGWKPGRPGGQAGGGWKPNRPAGQGGDRDRGWKPSRPAGEGAGGGDRGRIPTGPAGKPSGDEGRWKPSRPGGPGRSGDERGWKPSRPAGQTGGEGERGRKPSGPAGQGSGGERGFRPSRPAGSGGGDRPWKPNRPAGQGSGGGERGWKPNRPAGAGGGGDRGWKPSRPSGPGGTRGRSWLEADSARRTRRKQSRSETKRASRTGRRRRPRVETKSPRRARRRW